MHRIRAGIVAATVCLLGACSRTTWVNELDVPGLCPPDAQRYAPAPVLRWVSSRPGTPADSALPLRVRIIARADEQLVMGAAVLIASSPRIGRLSDSLGMARFDTVIVPGRYQLITRRIGYHARRDSITLPAEPGAVLEVPLERAITDGPCSGFAMVKVRRRWWRLW